MPSQKDPKARQTVNTAPGYVQSAVGAAPAPSQPEPASCRFGSNPPRAFSWAPDRKVRFGTKAGGMEEAPPPNEFNAANLFLCRNPDLDLWNFLGLSLGADQRSIMAAWRRRSRALHPDKVAEKNALRSQGYFAEPDHAGPIHTVESQQDQKGCSIPSSCSQWGAWHVCSAVGCSAQQGTGFSWSLQSNWNWLSDRPATAATSEAVLKCEASLPWL